jgi:antirestriction protein
METNIFITNLSKYNEGKLVGEWVTLPLNPNTLQAIIKKLLQNDDELFISDYEADFEISEYQDLFELNKFVKEYSELDEYEKVAVKFLINVRSYTFQKAINEKDDLIIYKADSYADLAYEFGIDGLFGDISDQLRNYIDYEKIGRDLEIDYYEFDGYYINQN